VFHLRAGDIPAVEGYGKIIGISTVDVCVRFRMLPPLPATLHISIVSAWFP